MKCFVAMAFGRQDTDQLFDNLISKTLHELGIQAVRVDRLERNDDIDDMIVQEIRSADFAIADLTYSRPSVYYEAGYAEREIPVIYVIRRDHLKPRPDDDFGIFKVHFDLQMKNVIDWIDPADDLFASRLKSRIEVVTAPILRRTSAIDEERRNDEAFQALPFAERLTRLRGVCRPVLEEFGLKVIRESARSDDYSADGLKTQNNVIQYVDLNFPTSKEKIYHVLLDDPYFDLNFNDVLKSLQRVEEIKINCTMAGISMDDVCRSLKEYKPVAGQKAVAAELVRKIPVIPWERVGEVHYDYEWGLLSYGDKGWSVRDVPAGVASKRSSRDGFRLIRPAERGIPRHVRYCIVDEIKSEDSFRRKLREALRAAL